jgi:hypothetical protein
METGKIRLLNPGGEKGVNGLYQTIAVDQPNRLYRITNLGQINGGNGNMEIRITRRYLGLSFRSTFDLETGRSVDVVGSTVQVVATETLSLLGSYDAL